MQASLPYYARGPASRPLTLNTLARARPRPSSSMLRVSTPTSVLLPLSTLPITASRTSMGGWLRGRRRTSTSAMQPPTAQQQGQHHGRCGAEVRRADRQHAAAGEHTVQRQVAACGPCWLDEPSRNHRPPAAPPASSPLLRSRMTLTSAATPPAAARSRSSTVASCCALSPVGPQPLGAPTSSTISPTWLTWRTEREKDKCVCVLVGWGGGWG